MDTNAINLWDRRLARFQILLAMQRADDKFGKLAMAELEAKVGRLEIIKRHGTDDPRKLCERGRAELQAVYDAQDAANEASLAEFYEPLHHAAVALLRTPAPDFAAVQIKIQAINELHVDTCDEFADGEAYQLIQAELRALLAEAE